MTNRWSVVSIVAVTLALGPLRFACGSTGSDASNPVESSSAGYGSNGWFYDAGAKTLFLWAPGGGVPTSVYAKKRNYAFDLRGKSYITVTGASLFASTVTMDDVSQNNTLDGVKASYLSHWQSAQYDSSLAFAGIYDANHRFDSGIVMHGTNHTLKNSELAWSSGNGVNLRGSGSTVSNNSIHDVGYGGTYTAATSRSVRTISRS